MEATIGILSTISIASTITAVYALNKFKKKTFDNLSLEEQIKKNQEILQRNELSNSSLEKQISEYNKNLTGLKNEYEELLKKQNENKLLNEKINTELEEKNLELQDLIKLEQESQLIENTVIELRNKIQEYENEKSSLTTTLNDLKKDIQLYLPTQELIAVGFFEEPDYLFETSQRFKEEIQIIRNEQRELIKSGKAITIPEQIAFINKEADAKSAIKGQSKIMLKAFNIETDLLISSLKPSNFASTLEKIEKLANDIEKSALSLACGFTENYIKLKYEECKLQYQFKLKQADEKEEQKAIKEQMREENQAIREYERALAKAEKEEKMYRTALEQARKELDIADGKSRDELLAKISFLELNLEEALAQEERAKSMAQQTKKGYVYIISNIGSFGKNVYKIGMTRRLEPLDRVKELGDASVPFLFDVHAMIFSDNAPQLERELHKRFTHKRLNAINHRKEFFNVSLDEIKQAVENITEMEIDFKMTALAEDYHESIKLRDVF